MTAEHRILVEVRQLVADDRLDHEDCGLAGAYNFDLAREEEAAGGIAEAARRWFHERQPVACPEDFDIVFDCAPRDRDIPIEDQRLLPERELLIA